MTGRALTPVLEQAELPLSEAAMCDDERSLVREFEHAGTEK